MGYNEGVRTGYETTSRINPFSAILERVDEARARKAADDKDLKELETLFLQLGKKHEYDTAIEKQKAEIGLQLEKEKGVQDRLTKLSEGYTFDESGNEIEPVYQDIAGQETSQPIDGTQRLMEMTGLAIPRKSKQPVISKKQPIKTDRTAEIFGLSKDAKIKKKDNALQKLKEEKLIQLIDKDKKAQEERDNFILDSASDTLNTIKEVEKGMDYFGLTGDFPSIPGTPRKNWEVNINKLLSGKIIDVMTKMKEASKTGATGFGQLSNKELEVLRQASTSLKRGLSKKDAKRYLDDMKVAMEKIVNKKSIGSTQQSELSPEDRKALIEKIRAKNGSR